jgi:hypothetical protein
LLPQHLSIVDIDHDGSRATRRTHWVVTQKRGNLSSSAGQWAQFVVTRWSMIGSRDRPPVL